MKYFIGFLFLISGPMVRAQHQITFYILNEDSHQPVQAANVVIKGQQKGWVSDSLGFVLISSLNKSSYEFQISATSFADKMVRLTFPGAGSDTIRISLEPDVEMLGEVIVQSSRTNSRIKDLPTRVEVIGTEDMEEETSMHPGNVAMLLSEASGIQTQQTSASSGNIQIRILGLDGKYTQLLKDGFPMYSGFSNGLSIMQIPPLDLRQVELVKGSSSSLYGGDAIAGIINFISKTPTPGMHWNFLINQTNRGGTDMGSFAGNRNKHWGGTLLNTFTHQIPVNIYNNGFTVLPKLTAYMINPKLFWYPTEKAKLSLALNTTYDNRTGGDLIAVQNGPTPNHPYIEHNQSRRNYYQLEYDQQFSRNNHITFRNSTSLFKRDITITDYQFSGQQASTFSEFSYLFNRGKHQIVIGANFITDQFSENRKTDSLIRDYRFVTTGIFIQDNWSINKNWVLETGIRYDHQNRFGNFLIPRIALLTRISPQWSIRLGAGLGYKQATIFDAQTEETAYKDVLPIAGNVRAETAGGMNASIHYSGRIDEDIFLVFDQSFFYTQVNNPLILDTLVVRGSPVNFFNFVNGNNPFTTRGFETSIRLKQEGWSLFAGYTFVDARTGINAQPHIALAPASKVVFNLSQEKENNYRIALEAFYTGPQYLSDGTRTRDYWVTGLLLEKVIKRLTLVLNFEDISDTRQTRFGPVVIPPITDPGFREIYAPMEGFIANLAVKVKIF